MRAIVPRSRIRAGAAVASLLFHVVLLLAIAWWDGSARPRPPPQQAAAGSRVVFMDVLPLVTAQVIAPPRESQAPSPEGPRPGSPPATIPGEAASSMSETGGSVGRSAAPARPASSAAALRHGFSDPRLHIQPGALRPEAPAATLEQSFRSALEADDEARARMAREDLSRRQIHLFGRSVTVFGDSSKADWTDLTVILSGRRAVLPIDGREWEALQMRKQSADFVRDSILRERARETRERVRR